MFAKYPDLQPLFKGDRAAQELKLMQAIKLVVTGATDLGKLNKVLSKLGESHVEYGVQEEHFAMVADALLATLDAGLGEKFTPDVKEAWTTLYTEVSGVMLSAFKAQKTWAGKNEKRAAKLQETANRNLPKLE